MSRKLLLFCLLFIFVLSACSPKQQEVTFKVAALPVLDSLPLYVAQEAGYFEKAGVKVEIIPVSSAPERDQLMQSKQVDGMLSELVTTLYYNKATPQIKIIRFARTATPQSALFRILAAKDSGITSPDQLKGVEIGISQGTVIEYVTDRLLEKAGLKSDEVKKIAVPRIADRTALLQSGELKAAVIPDPLASMLIQKGAVLVIDDTKAPDISNSIFSFRNEVLQVHPQQVKIFLAALEQAIIDINENPAGYDKMLAEKKLVAPDMLKNGFILPPFPVASVPNQSQFEDALAWAMAKGMVSQKLNYADNIDGQFLPK